MFLTCKPTTLDLQLHQILQINRDVAYLPLMSASGLRWNWNMCDLCQHPRIWLHRRFFVDSLIAYLVPLDEVIPMSAAISVWMTAIHAPDVAPNLLKQLRHIQHCEAARDRIGTRSIHDNENHFNLLDVVIPILERRLLSMMPGCSPSDAITELYPGSSLADRDDSAS